MTDRRSFLTTACVVVSAAAPAISRAVPGAPAGAGLPVGARVPQFEFVYECEATLSAALEMGKTVEGQRRIIPITGGSVRGPKIRAELLSGGWDWNLSRSDGAGSVDAAYYMRTDDGVLIRIVNKGVGGGGRPAAPSAAGELFFMFTHPEFEAPAGKYDWLNRSMFVGTLGARRGAHNAVLIRVFQVV
jgi:hypothetical protein